MLILAASGSLQGQKSVQVNSSIPMAFSSLISSCEKLEEFGKAYFVIVSLLITSKCTWND